MTLLRSLLLAIVLAAALLAAGCGAASEDDEGGAPGAAGASLVPADAALFVSINTDFGSAQWQTAEALLAKFPSGGKLVGSILEEIETEGVTWEDVKAAVGPELDVAALSWADVDSESFVGLTQPADPAKLEALLAKGENQLVSGEIEGWTVFADSQETLDRFESARDGGSLADSEDYASAMADLPEEGLGTLYLNGQALLQSIAAESSEDAQAVGSLSDLFGKLGAVGASLSAEEGGVRLAGSATMEDGPAAEPYEAELASHVPADAVAFVSFNDLAGLLDQVLDAVGQSTPEFDQQLGFLEGMLGVSLRDDVLPLFAQEGALVVAPGTPIPTISLVLEVESEEDALATIDKLIGAVGAFASLGNEDAASAPQPQSTTIEGVAAREVPLGEFSLFYAGFDGKLVVSSTREGIGGLLDQSPKLADDPAFAEARDAAGMPDETSGFVYVNLGEVLPMVMGLAQAGGEGVPTEVAENLEPLESLLVYGSRDGDRYTVSGFLAIE